MQQELCKYEFLKTILLEVIEENSPEVKETFLMLFNSLRDKNTDSTKIKDLFHEISESQHLMGVIKACSLHNIILNIYEEQEQAKIASVSRSIATVYKNLEEEGFDRIDCDRVLEKWLFHKRCNLYLILSLLWAISLSL